MNGVPPFAGGGYPLGPVPMFWPGGLLLCHPGIAATQVVSLMAGDASWLVVVRAVAIGGIPAGGILVKPLVRVFVVVGPVIRGTAAVRAGMR